MYAMFDSRQAKFERLLICMKPACRASLASVFLAFCDGQLRHYESLIWFRGDPCLRVRAATAPELPGRRDSGVNTESRECDIEIRWSYDGPEDFEDTMRTSLVAGHGGKWGSTGS